LSEHEYLSPKSKSEWADDFVWSKLHELLAAKDESWPKLLDSLHQDVMDLPHDWEDHHGSLALVTRLIQKLRKNQGVNTSEQEETVGDTGFRAAARKVFDRIFGR